MYLRTQNRSSTLKLILAAALGLALAAVALSPSPAQAQTGGVSAGGDGSSGDGSSGDGSSGGSTQLEQANSRTVAGKRARLRNGYAIAPRRAPLRVKRVIWAANEIAKGKGYCWGGGHGRHNSPCYDCSGAASYALRGGNFVKGSMPSTGYYRWGKRGRGNWITVFTNSGHMYITVAGLRFDTSMTPGTGPSWSNQMRSDSGFRKRRPSRSRF